MKLVQLVITLLLGIPGVAAMAARVKPALDYVEGLLKGEPARLIGYGAAVVIYLVAAAFGRIPDMTMDQALTTATVVIGLLVAVIEAIRKYVYSPATVEGILAEVKADAP